jgi:hypothetical protein
MSTFVLYARGHRSPDQYPRDHVVVFPTAERAKVWLMKMEHNLPEGFTIRSQQMDQIRAAAETDWQLDDEHANWILRFKYGTWDEVHVKDEPEVAEAKAASPGGVSKAKRAAKAQRPDGYVTITELCAASGVAASDARQILRATFDKPEFGWAFDPKQVPAIKKLVGIK